MGCAQSTQASEPVPNMPMLQTSGSRTLQTQSSQPTTTTQFATQNSNQKMVLTMIGNTSVQSMVLGYTGTDFRPIPSQIPIPRYCHALLHDSSVGYITGGIEDLQANVNAKATIDTQILEGTISKKFIRVDMRKLVNDPSISLELLPEMINARYAHCAIEVQETIYALGGRQYGPDENGLLSACEKFNFSSKKWKSIPSLQFARAAASVVLYGEHLYIFGGYSGNKTRTRAIESYSDGDSSWRRLPFDLHEGLEGALVVKKPGSECSVLIFGGKTNFGKSNRVVELNFDRSSVSGYAPMKQQRCFHKGQTVDGQVILIGGGSQYTQSYNILQQTSEINRELSYLEYCTIKQLSSFSQFQEQPHLSFQRKPTDTPFSERRVHVFGHAFEPFAKIINTDNFMVTNEGQSLYHNFYQFTTVVRVNREHSFVMGGISPDLADVTNRVYSFSLLNGQIKPLDSMISARYAFGAGVLGSHLYVVGGRKLGEDDVAILNQCERFSFETYKWEAIASMKHKRQSATVVSVGEYVVVIGGYKGNEVRSNQIQIFVSRENRWAELDYKFELSVESMTPVVDQNTIFLFGGRGDTDIKKIFRLNLDLDTGVKAEKSVRAELQPVGQLSNPGTNLKVFVDGTGVAFVFGNIPYGIDVYDLRKHRVVQTQQIPVFSKLKDPLFQAYTLIY